MVHFTIAGVQISMLSMLVCYTVCMGNSLWDNLLIARLGIIGLMQYMPHIMSRQ